MGRRPLRAEEVSYLKNYKASLDASLQALWITLGLVGLPAIFLLFTLTSRQTGGDRLSMALAGVILLGLMGAVVYYTARESRTKKLKLDDARLFKGLVEDLREEEAASETVTLTGKETKQVEQEEGSRKQFYLVVGQQKFQVTGSRWMSLAVGEDIALEYAMHSKVVLTVNGENERLAIVSKFGREPIDMERMSGG